MPGDASPTSPGDHGDDADRTVEQSDAPVSPFSVDVAGLVVTQRRIDYAVTLQLGEDVVVRIEGPFTVTDADGRRHVVDPEGPPALVAPALAVARSTAAHATAFADGRLELAFTDGTQVSVASDDGFEAWELSAGDGLLVVSGPGARRTVWSPTPGPLP